MTHLIIGMGEVGTGLYTHFLAKGGADQIVYTFDLEKSTGEVLGTVDVLHICFPYSPDIFEAEVGRYIGMCQPKLVVVYSTVPVGTVRNISHHVPIVHSPVEGVHPRLSEAFGSFLRIVGFNNQVSYEMARQYLEPLFPSGIHMIHNTSKTELMKLLSTGYRYPMYIAMAQEQERVCKMLGFDYTEIVTDYDKVYNAGFQRLGKTEVNRPLAYPGAIGGHCIRPNMEMLGSSLSLAPDGLDFIKESDQLKRDES